MLSLLLTEDPKTSGPGQTAEAVPDVPLDLCQTFIRAAALTSQPAVLSESLEQVLREIGTPLYAFMAANIAGRQMREPAILTNYPEEWRRRYVDGNYTIRDPVVRGMQNRLTPMVWGTQAEYNELPPEGRKHYDEAAEFGLRIGLIVPLYFSGQEYATFAVASDEAEETFLPKAFWRATVMQVIAPYIYDALRRISGGGTVEAEALTRREAECLAWAAQGNSMADIGTILGVSRNTVIFHLGNAKRKLGVDTLQGAVARAMSLGYVCTDGVKT